MIRFARAEDAADIAAIYAPIVRETFISFETVPHTEDEMRARIAKTLVTHPWLVDERGGRIVGYAYGSPHRAR